MYAMTILSACTKTADVSRTVTEPVTVDIISESDTAVLGTPMSMVADSESGDLYVLEAVLGRVFHYNRRGTLLSTFGSLGGGPSELGSPAEIYLVKGTVVVADDGAKRLKFFGPDGRSVVRSIAYKGFPGSGAVSGDGELLMGMLQSEGKTMAAILRPGADTLSYFASMPRSYTGKAPLASIFATTVVTWRDGLALVLAQATDSIQVVGMTDASSSALFVPRSRRTGVLKDEKAMAGMKWPQLLASHSAAFGMKALSDGSIVVVHMDLKAAGPATRANVWATRIGRDGSPICVDVPLATDTDARPLIAFRGDTLLMLRQRMSSDSSSVTELLSWPAFQPPCSGGH